MRISFFVCEKRRLNDFVQNSSGFPVDGPRCFSWRGVSGAEEQAAAEEELAGIVVVVDKLNAARFVAGASADDTGDGCVVAPLFDSEPLAGHQEELFFVSVVDKSGEKKEKRGVFVL